MRKMPSEAPWAPGCLLGASWVPPGSKESMDTCLFRKYKNYLFPKYKKSNPYEMNLLYKKNENKGSP